MLLLFLSSLTILLSLLIIPFFLISHCLSCSLLILLLFPLFFSYCILSRCNPHSFPDCFYPPAIRHFPPYLLLPSHRSLSILVGSSVRRVSYGCYFSRSISLSRFLLGVYCDAFVATASCIDVRKESTDEKKIGNINTKQGNSKRIRKEETEKDITNVK